MSKEIKGSVLLKDYIDKGYIPSVNKLLDFRNRLGEMLKEGEHPKEFINKEIEATDYLLNKKQNKEPVK